MNQTIRFVIRMPDELHTYLVAWAKREHRSLNGQILWLLVQASQADQKGDPHA